MVHILAVDDDEVILKVLKAMLMKAGHTVVLAKDGHEACAGNFLNWMMSNEH